MKTAFWESIFKVVANQRWRPLILFAFSRTCGKYICILFTDRPRVYGPSKTISELPDRYLIKMPAYKPLFVKPWCQESEKCKYSRGSCGKLEFISSCLLLVPEKLMHLLAQFSQQFSPLLQCSLPQFITDPKLCSNGLIVKNVWHLRGELGRGFTILFALY